MQPDKAQYSVSCSANSLHGTHGEKIMLLKRVSLQKGAESVFKRKAQQLNDAGDLRVQKGRPIAWTRDSVKRVYDYYLKHPLPHH